MTNNQILKKLSQDMKMRNFSHYTYDSYMGKTKEIIEYNLEKIARLVAIFFFWC